MKKINVVTKNKKIDPEFFRQAIGADEIVFDHATIYRCRARKRFKPTEKSCPYGWTVLTNGRVKKTSICPHCGRRTGVPV